MRAESKLFRENFQSRTHSHSGLSDEISTVVVGGGRICVNTKILTDLCHQYPCYVYDIYELYCRDSLVIVWP
jgi:hypothetical protein